MKRIWPFLLVGLLGAAALVRGQQNPYMGLQQGTWVVIDWEKDTITLKLPNGIQQTMSSKGMLVTVRLDGGKPVNFTEAEIRKAIK